MIFRRHGLKLEVDECRCRGLQISYPVPPELDYSGEYWSK